MRTRSVVRFCCCCLASVAFSTGLDAQQPSACRRSSSPFSDLQRSVERWVSSEDSLDAAFRRDYQLPHLPPDSIVRVTEERICEQAARAYYRGYVGPTPLDGVEVIRVGDTYVVYGSKRGGEWTALEFYTRDFELTGGVLR